MHSPTSRKLLPKFAGWAALHQQEIHGTAALILEVGSLLRLASELRQQRLDPRGVVDADAQVEVVVYSGLLAYQRIDAPATVNPIVDAAGVKGGQHLDYVLTRHVSHDAREFPTGTAQRRYQGQVCSREELLPQVWGYSFDPCTNVVDVYITRLRAKLGAEVIETVRNVGYCLRTD